MRPNHNIEPGAVGGGKASVGREAAAESGKLNAEKTELQAPRATGKREELLLAG